MSRSISLDCLTLPDVTPVDLVRIAGEAGYASISLWVQPPAISPPMLATPEMTAAIRRALDESGVALGNLEVFNLNSDEPVAAWEGAIAFGASLGARTATTIDYGPPRPDIAERLAAFDALCRRHGLTTLIEPISMGNVRTPRDGTALIHSAGIDARLVLDVLHLVRTGTTPASLRDIPADRIGYLQICDGPDTIMPEELGTEATANRLYPGEGAFLLVELVAMLAADVPLGVEVPSLTRRRRGDPPLARAREALAATWALLARAEWASR